VVPGGGKSQQGVQGGKKGAVPGMGGSGDRERGLGGKDRYKARGKASPSRQTKKRNPRTPEAAGKKKDPPVYSETTKKAAIQHRQRKNKAGRITEEHRVLRKRGKGKAKKATSRENPENQTRPRGKTNNPEKEGRKGSPKRGNLGL